MKRSLLALALIAAAGAAGAQTEAPSTLKMPEVATKSKIDTEATAKAALEAHGYKSISSLRMGADGKWSGSAMKGSQQVAVSVDAEGNVSSPQ